MSSQRAADPLNHGQSEHTALKQEWLRRILRQQASIVAGHQRYKGVGPFWYLDLFAGPGHDSQGEPGSPLVALDVLSHSGVEWNMRCWNRNPAHHDALIGAFGEAYARADALTEAPIQGDCTKSVPAWLATLTLPQRASARGVCYVDPNGDVPWELLGRIAANLPSVDILIHLSATLVKRLRECSSIPRTTYLQEHIATVPKSHWLITPLDGPHQWTFLFASNWKSQPGIKEIRFVPVTSEWGKHFLRQANHTREELRVLPIEGQLPLFGGL